MGSLRANPKSKHANDQNQIVAVQEESWKAKREKKNASAARCNS